jgi:hypothetical protein
MLYETSDIAIRTIVGAAVLCAFALTGCGADDPQTNLGAAIDATGGDVSAFQDGAAVATGDAGAAGGEDSGVHGAEAGALTDSGAAGSSGTDGGSTGSSSGADAGSSGGTDTASSGSGSSSGGGSQPSSFNSGWIGGQCAAKGECLYTQPICLAQAPEGGMCSQTCTKFCPDKTGFSTTFCVDGKHFGTTGGVCTARCDYTRTATGCRPGYKCVNVARFNDPATTKLACVPGKADKPVGSETWCHDKLTKLGVSWTHAPNPKGVPKGWTQALCDIPDAVYIGPVISGIKFRPSTIKGTPKKMLFKCAMALQVAKMAATLKTKNVTDVVHYGTYNCRVISGTKTLSEHGLANALDIAGFGFSTGLVHMVLKDWEKGIKVPKTAGGSFLRWFADKMHADKVFNVILTPEFNAAHANHFHVDMTPGSNFLKDEAPKPHWCGSQN